MNIIKSPYIPLRKGELLKLGFAADSLRFDVEKLLSGWTVHGKDNGNKSPFLRGRGGFFSGTINKTVN
ncbi:MAG: hypothetical protein WD431_23000 [Cyclobacteriaceae bacterium]